MANINKSEIAIEISKIIAELIDNLIIVADKYEQDRDIVMKVFSNTIAELVEEGTFSEYEVGA